MRLTPIAFSATAVGLALFAFWPFHPGSSGRAASPRRTTTGSDSPPIAPAEPAWRTLLRAISGEPDPTKRAVHLGLLAETLPVAELRAVIASLLSEADGTPGAQLRLLLLRRWADQDPAAAAAWADGLPGADSQTADWSSVGYGLAQKNPAGAVTLAVRQPPSQPREALLQYAVQQWARLDRNSALAWAGRLPDLKMRDEFLSIIAVEWARQEPAQAAAFTARAVTAGKPRDEAMLQIAACWTRAAPEQAAGWISRLPSSETDVRDFAIEQLTDTWARKDLVNAGEWVMQLPGDGSRDAASCAYVPVLAITDPDLAVVWLGEIQDPAIRAAAWERMLKVADLPTAGSL